MRLSVKLSMKLSKMDGIHYKHPVIAIILLLFCSRPILLLNNNNNNDKVDTPLSEKCSQSRVFISQCHIIHIVQYYAYWLVWFM